MIKRFSVISGIAIIAVVLNHAGNLGQQALFIRTNLYLPVSVPNWDQLGSFQYYALMTIRQLANFSVPAFFFVSGYFAAYALRGAAKNPRQIVYARLKFLIIPYLIWSTITFLGEYMFGRSYAWWEYLLQLFSIGSPGPYWFIPQLCLFTILGLFFTRLAKSNWKLLLVSTLVIQFCSASIFYFQFFNIKFPGLDTLVALTPFYSPLHSVVYFALGIIVSLNPKPIKELLIPAKKLIYFLVPLFGLLTILETDYMVRSSLNINLNAFFGTLSFSFYALSCIALFIVMDKFPQVNFLIWVGGKTFGIYLLHYICMEIALKIIVRAAPQLFGIQILFQPLVLIAGIGVPLLILYIASRLPTRRIYRYIFG